MESFNPSMLDHRSPSPPPVPNIEERPAIDDATMDEDAQAAADTLAQEDARVQEEQSAADTTAEVTPAPVPDPPSVVLIRAWGELLGELDDLRDSRPDLIPRNLQALEDWLCRWEQYDVKVRACYASATEEELTLPMSAENLATVRELSD
ncbi:hypothetical protein P692DRAFT_201805801 [Suillus brevipes Sb2]|nr:hypothetical protein P692DRAFT_201805801 [Suillus brevipes Sb2]